MEAAHGCTTATVEPVLTVNRDVKSVQSFIFNGRNEMNERDYEIIQEKKLDEYLEEDPYPTEKDWWWQQDDDLTWKMYWETLDD